MNATVVAEPNTFPIGNADIKGLDEDINSSASLSAEQAFNLQIPVYTAKQLKFIWRIQPNHYLYKEQFILLPNASEGFKIGKIQLPKGEIKQDPSFGQVEAIHDPASVNLPIERVDLTRSQLPIDVGWQGCQAGKNCYPPQRKRFMLTWANANADAAVSISEVVLSEEQSNTPLTKPAPLSEQDQLATTLAEQNIVVTLLIFLGLGVLLALTPCVFPMIPILSGIIVGQKNITPRKAFGLSLVYVLAMACTYTLAGILAGLFGQNLQAYFQNPWILGAFSGIFVLLALSMFGLYDLQMPAGVQARLTQWSNRQTSGSLVGVAVMGALSALIVGPCVAAPLAGVLIYIGQTGNAMLGGAALFSLSMGMGLPLILIGTMSGLLPKAGLWMETVKRFFGIILLGVAIWLIERILPAYVSSLLWAALFIFAAFLLGLVKPAASKWQKVARGLGALSLVYGLVLGGTAIWSHLHEPTAIPHSSLAFKRVSNLTELNAALAEAKGKPVMLDIYADWCTTCKEFELHTFSQAAVQAALKDTVLLQVDVTHNSAEQRELQKFYQIIGPPAILFFDQQAQEQTTKRIVGFMPAEEFLKKLASSAP
jgi:thiol:disulfide interchange protein DsbD